MHTSSQCRAACLTISGRHDNLACLKYFWHLCLLALLSSNAPPLTSFLSIGFVHVANEYDRNLMEAPATRQGLVAVMLLSIVPLAGDVVRVQNVIYGIANRKLCLCGQVNLFALVKCRSPRKLVKLIRRQKQVFMYGHWDLWWPGP